MQQFFEIAKTDFMATFEGAYIFWMLLFALLWILWKEKDWNRKLLLGFLPFCCLFIYWCPLTGTLFMKLLGENVYWRILWLILLAVVIPYAACMVLKTLKGKRRYASFFAFFLVIVLGGKKLLSAEWFEASTNVYKLPQNVIEVCELLPSNVHVLVSNRLLPYIRQYDTSLTLEYGRNAMTYNYNKEVIRGADHQLYYAVQQPEIDVAYVAPLAKSEGCTFLVLSNSRTYTEDWEDYGYKEYAATSEFTIFVDMDYKEGEDTRKWED